MPVNGGVCRTVHGALHLFANDTTDYWRTQVDAFRPQTRMGVDRPALNILASSAWVLAKHSLKIAFAPTFTLLDIPRALFRGIPSEIERRLLDRYEFHLFDSPQINLRFPLAPLDLTQRNGLHLLAYFALAALGYNAPVALINGKDESYLDDLNVLQEPNPALNDDEILLLIFPPDSVDPVFKQALVSQALEDRSINILAIRNRNVREILIAMGEFRKYGRLKDVRWGAHGDQGGLNMEAGSFFQQLTRQPPRESTLDSKALEENKDVLEGWPKDLFAPGARLTFFSCSVASGKKGEEFLEHCGDVTVKENGGTVAAPARAFRFITVGNDRDRVRHHAEKRAWPHPFSWDGLEHAAYYHFKNLLETELVFVLTKLSGHEPGAKLLRYKPGQAPELLTSP